MLVPSPRLFCRPSSITSGVGGNAFFTLHCFFFPVRSYKAEVGPKRATFLSVWGTTFFSFSVAFFYSYAYEWGERKGGNREEEGLGGRKKPPEKNARCGISPKKTPDIFIFIYIFCGPPGHAQIIGKKIETCVKLLIKLW